MENHKDLLGRTICENKNSDVFIPYLDEKIIYDILVRLRAKKIHRRRYICKQWFELISSSRFIYDHLRQSRHGFLAISRAAFHSEVSNRYRYVDLDNIQIENGRNVTISRFKSKCKKIVKSSCNGLLLLDDMPSVGRLIVANPVTDQLVELPPCTLWPETCDIIRGITFLGSTEEYKVASLIFDETGSSLKCEMLTLGSTFGKWKCVDLPFKRLLHLHVMTYGSVIIKGVFHFICSGIYEDDSVQSWTIFSFDTAGEKFYKSDAPAFSRMEALHEIEGCPSLVVPNEAQAQSLELCQWDIWILKDLNMGEWHKLYSVNLIEYGYRFPQRWHYSKVVATHENGRFFILLDVQVDRNTYSVYDVQLQQLTPLRINKPQLGYAFLPYAESLVSCPES